MRQLQLTNLEITGDTSRENSSQVWDQNSHFNRLNLIETIWEDSVYRKLGLFTSEKKAKIVWSLEVISWAEKDCFASTFFIGGRDSSILQAERNIQ